MRRTLADQGGFTDEKHRFVIDLVLWRAHRG
jgi:hypothetical protein